MLNAVCIFLLTYCNIQLLYRQYLLFCMPCRDYCFLIQVSFNYSVAFYTFAVLQYLDTVKYLA